MELSLSGQCTKCTEYKHPFITYSLMKSHFVSKRLLVSIVFCYLHRMLMTSGSLRYDMDAAIR